MNDRQRSTCQDCGEPIARVSCGWAHEVDRSGRSPAGTVGVLAPPDHAPEPEEDP